MFLPAEHETTEMDSCKTESSGDGRRSSAANELPQVTACDSGHRRNTAAVLARLDVLADFEPGCADGCGGVGAAVCALRRDVFAHGRGFRPGAGLADLRSGPRGGPNHRPARRAATGTPPILRQAYYCTVRVAFCGAG